MTCNCWRCSAEFEADAFTHFCVKCEVIEKQEKQKRAEQAEAERIAEANRRAERKRAAAIAAEQAKEDEKRAQEAAREAWIKETLPESFRRFEGVPSGVDDAARIRAMSWYISALEQETNQPHLYLHGETGVGKTWTCNSIIKIAALDVSLKQLQCDAIVRTDGMRFQRDIQLNVLAGTLDDYLTPLRNAWLLVFDELDKLKGTPRTSIEFFDLLNFRIEHEMPTVLASFAKPIQVAKLFEQATDKQLGVQIGRRMRDFFTIIHMKRKDP